MAAGLVGKRKTARSAPDRLWRVNVGGGITPPFGSRWWYPDYCIPTISS